jgi:hypothetical protein
MFPPPAKKSVIPVALPAFLLENKHIVEEIELSFTQQAKENSSTALLSTFLLSLI